jgi:Transposase
VRPRWSDLGVSSGLVSIPQLTGHNEYEVAMSVMEKKPARTRRSFTEEFKRDAVAMVLDDDNKIVDVARRLGVGEGTLVNWVRQERIDWGE